MRRLKCTLLVLATLLLCSCNAYKEVPYLQGSEYLDRTPERTPLYDAHIMPKDLLTITVNTSDPDAAIPFNLTVATPITANSKSLTSQPALQQYLVDNNGDIDFPVLGTLHIGGLTKSQAESMIKEKLKAYIKETPIVNVRMANYKISVMGEVTSPGTFTITNEKVNIMEALAMAGDMTIYGQRDQVKLIREDAQGSRRIIPLNLNGADIISSPYYYLQQNDVVYVTPNKTKARNAGISNSTTIWFSVVGTLVSLVSLIVTIAK
ncbi:polysaccharide biosynthesis/export family protein [Phocaeicola sartorii]|jgi:polysaccharide export outer membrane protein|uniref:Polysaccharide export outer membrane protein n=1 Tax=Phocaeicola sartorii TaxID=671267 RepID=R9IA27_9BACT|nr:polysaccharide biosynthesis/export family protein [Phocaeicola sartorii]EOS13730.1 polysaccharide export outer membrane protein [Phocaeicola sartorii]MCR1844002.1 polysaccharide export protein [Phocaeicola sartorii]NUL00348.1 polysaccharide export protein [Phocaeicola sartorii]